MIKTVILVARKLMALEVRKCHSHVSFKFFAYLVKYISTEMGFLQQIKRHYLFFLLKKINKFLKLHRREFFLQLSEC